MNKLYILIAASMLMINAYSVQAETGWEDNFDPIKTTWVETTAVWTDLSGSTAKLTENDSTLSYGFAQSEPITLDVSKYKELLISVSAVDSGALYSVQIQEVGGAEAYANAISNMGFPGTKIVDISSLMGWSGTKTFVINIWIDGESKGVAFDTLQIRATETGMAAWSEDFNPVKLSWTQESCLWTDSEGIGAVLTESNPSVSYGVVRSEILTIDLDIYNELYVKTTAIDSGCYYSVQIQEIGGSGEYRDAISYAGGAATQIIDIAKLMNWSGTKTFQINIWLDGESKSTTFEKIELRNGEKLPGYIYWRDHFNPRKELWYDIGAYWTDNGDSTSTVTEDQPGISYGKVESETLDVDVSLFPEITVDITNVTGGWLDVAIQEQEGYYAASNVITAITAPGIYKGNVADAMGWTGRHKFRIVLWVNGNGKSYTFDSIQLAMDCGTNLLAGDYNEDCQVDFQDLANIAETWMSEYDMLDVKDISDNWLDKAY
ncbi:MAG: hypothetical protein A2Y12_20205 [Planctomycetes bacterium GWF2_42_9]|nr:MAG: hypothetical protein A2Y12_20205 [Planctomycetes bacterium GWF2_42_9]